MRHAINNFPALLPPTYLAHSPSWPLLPLNLATPPVLTHGGGISIYLLNGLMVEQPPQPPPPPPPDIAPPVLIIRALSPNCYTRSSPDSPTHPQTPLSNKGKWMFPPFDSSAASFTLRLLMLLLLLLLFYCSNHQRSSKRHRLCLSDLIQLKIMPSF